MPESSTSRKDNAIGGDFALPNFEPTRRVDSGMYENSAWARQNILTFDGGGIRGYYSLLHLDKLMRYIERAEKEADEAENDGETPRQHSSFSPCGEPRDVSHRAMYLRYLPCHYFDYIGGTSTGALITIMLARLRMPIEDCMEEYRRLAGDVFGHPRIFHQVGKRGFIFRKNKFPTTNLELAIKDVIRRRGEIANGHDDAMVFSTPKGLCRAIAFANRDLLGGDATGVELKSPWIFRSYDHYHKANGRGHRSKADDKNAPLNPGQGTQFAAWKVARAATAAPMFFKALEISLDDGEILPTRRTTTLGRELSFGTGPKNSQRVSHTQDARNAKRTTAMLTDGGFGPLNNPSEGVLTELRFILKKRYKKIGTWVSIGTARAVAGPVARPNIFNMTKKSFQEVGDTEPVHERMLRESQQKPNGFQYYRFNKPNGLTIEMDEWKPRGSGEGSGRDTIEAMEKAFQSWSDNLDVANDFQRCANELVATRRARAKESISLWERYALGKFYVCVQNDCPYDPDETWHYRTSFVQHLENDHKIDEGTIKAMLKECEYMWEYKPKNY